MVRSLRSRAHSNGRCEDRIFGLIYWEQRLSWYYRGVIAGLNDLMRRSENELLSIVY